MSEQTELTVPVRFSDLDSLSHVNHAKYLAYCEEYRVVLLRLLDAAAIGPPWGGRAVLARLQIDYLKPVTAAHREVRVSGEVLEVGRSSVRMRNHIRAGADLCAVVEASLIHIGADGGAEPMSPQQQDWWRQFQPEPGEE